MIKYLKKIVAVLPATIILSSCIQDEPLNAEADILSCNLSSDKQILVVAADTTMQISSISDNIDILAMAGADLTARAPKFTLTEGATISPANGSVQDFSDGKSVEYTVTSQDGQWKRVYKVSYVSFELPTKFEFESYVKSGNGKYHIITEEIEGRTMLNWWSTGNPGYSLAANETVKETEYPTAIVPGGVNGNCIQMVTRSAGSFGAMAGMPIAPGNLFLGSFNVANALKAPLAATKFGVPFRQIPTTIKGYYKFKAGPQMTNKSAEEVDGKDQFNIYAVFYENTDENGNHVMVDGDGTAKNPQNVLYGEIKDPKETDKWTEFTVEMEPVNGKAIDPERLANFGYNFAVIFTSSRKGDEFTGAVGSTLYVDEVTVECK